MKRALLVLVAALAFLLAYPSTQSVAGHSSSPYLDGPLTTKLVGGGPSGTDGADEDDGDADGLSGFDNKHDIGDVGGSSGAGGALASGGGSVEWVLLKTWWKFFIWIR
jgi:hypothetical protein